MKTFNTVMLLGALALFSACGAAHRIDIPDSMVELREASWSPYAQRGTTARGVVLGVQTIRQGPHRDVPRGDLAFWAEAMRLRLRTTSGYALVEERPVVSADGTEGLQLRFGRDQAREPFVYVVTLFVTEHTIHVVEAGGLASQYEDIADELARAIASYEVRR